MFDPKKQLSLPSSFHGQLVVILYLDDIHDGLIHCVLKVEICTLMTDFTLFENTKLRDLYFDFGAMTDFRLDLFRFYSFV